MRVLLIGFGPFPGPPFNPSSVLVKTLARRRRPALADVICTTHVFATTYAAVDRDLPKLFAQKPDVILMFGLAARRCQLCIETRARNAVSYCTRMQAVVTRSAASSCTAVRRRFRPPRRSPICSAPQKRATSLAVCRAMPDDICAITPTGAHWSALAAAGR